MGPLRERSCVKAARPPPDGQLLPRKPHRLPISLMSPFCDLTILSLSCGCSLLSKVCHVMVVVLSFRRVKRCKSCKSSKNNIYMFLLFCPKNQLHYLQLE